MCIRVSWAVLTHLDMFKLYTHSQQSKFLNIHSLKVLLKYKTEKIRKIYSLDPELLGNIWLQLPGVGFLPAPLRGGGHNIRVYLWTQRYHIIVYSVGNPSGLGSGGRGHRRSVFIRDNTRSTRGNNWGQQACFRCQQTGRGVTALRRSLAYFKTDQNNSSNGDKSFYDAA